MSMRIRLVQASALMLFLELSLIRLVGAYVLHLSYFSNFVLLGSFLGIGIGVRIILMAAGVVFLSFLSFSSSPPQPPVPAHVSMGE